MKNFIILFGLLITSCATGKINLNTPENTIKSYYEAKNNTEASRCFIENNYQGSVKKFWIEYRIIEKKPTTKKGHITTSGVIVKKDAIEITTEVKMNHPKKGNPVTKFWYHLQKFSNEWLIIEHYHIPDANYPPID